MKKFLFITIIFFVTKTYGQTTAEAEIIKLSNDKFRQEMNHDADSMANTLDDDFIGISSTGVKRNKVQYLANIRDTATIHNSIDIREAKVVMFENTAVLTGSGYFVVTAKSKTLTYHLSYMQVFIKRKDGWKMLALHGARLADN